MRSLLSTLRGLFDVLPKGAKPFYVWYSIITALLALLDTAALALIAVTITPLATGQPVTLPLIGQLPASGTVWLIVVVCLLFVIKGVFAVILHWYATRRFARYELEVGDSLFRAYSHSTWEQRSRLSTAEVTRIVDSSMANTNLQFILPLSLVPVNTFTFIGVLAVLVIAQPLTALIAFVYLSTISLLMLFVVTKRAQRAGTNNRVYAYRAATVMTEMVDALKELTLRGKLTEIGEVVSAQRAVATRARANLSFFGIVPKYGFEAALIGGFLLIGGAAYLIGGPSEAVIAISLFAATGFRMIPAMNGVQASFTSAFASQVYAQDVIRELKQLPEARAVITPSDRATLATSPQILEFRNVSFQYPGAERNVLNGIDLALEFGSQLAIVGPSGAGKSTLVDLILGLSTPSSGEILIDGVPITDLMHQWRERVGYVPQKVAIFDGSIAQNVALTWGNDFSEERVTHALERAELGSLLERPDGLNEKLGERGNSVSGGQQQRLGIARALYSDPLVLVLDEATSSLDTATESRVMASMRELTGEVTFVTIAHRLATIRDYDTICYLDDGRIVGKGRFEEVVEQVPDFALQAQLAGLL